MPLLETTGAASSKGFGQFARTGPVVYIEEVFSTYIYTGNNSTQTIINGIDLAGKGGMVWTKSRDQGSWPHIVTGTNFSNGYRSISTNNSNAETSFGDVTSWNSNGYTMGVNSGYMNYSGPFVSWTFREQAKFFDVVTYTGNGSASRAISHNLGSAPGFMIVKCLSDGFNWLAYHRSTGATTGANFNGTGAFVTSSTFWNDTEPTSTNFTVGNSTQVNNNGSTYVAYLFAHNAGGFGLTGTDNVISCGSFTTDGSGNATVNLGYEPQWVIIKSSATTGSWEMLDVMRRWSSTNSSMLLANSSNAESSVGALGFPQATGFTYLYGTGGENRTFIYIAIRRGPMKTPTTGTSVYSALAYSGDQTNNRILSQGTAGPADLFWFMNRNFGANTFSATGLYSPIYDRLRGIIVNNSSVGQLCPALGTPFTDAEGNVYSFTLANTQTDFSVSGAQGQLNWTNSTVLQMFRRAPGFFDEVCYTGTGSARTQAHNLGVAPELIIVKSRSNTGVGWPIYHNSITNPQNNVVYLNATAPSGFDTTWNFTAPTASVFSISGDANVSAWTFVAYLFASCPGVSKVGGYTGTGALQTINCGFTSGARFVLIKRTDSTGDWWVYDSARGITSGNDPYLFTNGTAAEVTGTNYVDTTSVGFQVTAAAPAGLNANGGSYIFLAIA